MSQNEQSRVEISKQWGVHPSSNGSGHNNDDAVFTVNPITNLPSGDGLYHIKAIVHLFAKPLVETMFDSSSWRTFLRMISDHQPSADSLPGEYGFSLVKFEGATAASQNHTMAWKCMALLTLKS